MTGLPKFTLESYEELLCKLAATGAEFRPVSAMGRAAAKDVFLRHDIDFSLELALPMAKVEHKLGISSTYYVLLSGPYNPCAAESVSAMRELASMGHNLGLHYDLSLYPTDPDAARERLELEINFLQALAGVPIETIVMHEPFRGQDDLFSISESWVNPTFYQRNDPGLLYVSDSCRAWRDDSLIRYLQGSMEKKCLLLNTHPESWLSNGSQHRITYLEQTLLPKILESSQRYFTGRVRHLWQTHVGAVSGYGDKDE